MKKILFVLLPLVLTVSTEAAPRYGSFDITISYDCLDLDNPDGPPYVFVTCYKTITIKYCRAISGDVPPGAPKAPNPHNNSVDLIEYQGSVAQVETGTPVLDIGGGICINIHDVNDFLNHGVEINGVRCN